MVLNGLLYINGTDVYTQHGAFLAEDKASDHSNYDALLKPANMKPYVAVAFREDNGETLPDTLLPRSEARDVTLQFAIIANGSANFLQKYAAFVAFLKAGWLNVNVPELNATFRMYMVNCSSYSQLTALDNGDCVAKFKVKFREPEPTY